LGPDQLTPLMELTALPHHWLPLAGLAAFAFCAWGLARRVRLARRRAWYRTVYLRSAHWRVRRARSIALAGGRCERCGKAGRLEVHHLTYARLGRERDRDLRALCHRCHRIAERSRRAGFLGVLGRMLGRLLGSLVAWSRGCLAACRAARASGSAGVE
jgi:HNH endonuclease